MTELRLSPGARADLVEIRLYSNQQFGGEVADKYFLGFEAAFDLLRQHPMVGPAKPQLGKGVRCLVHRRHRIFYIVSRGIVLILRIIHHAQDAKRALNS